MNVCGLWQGTHRLAAAITNDDGTLRPTITTPATPEHIGHLLDYLVTAGIDTLILAERSHCLIAQARDRRLHVRLVPHDLLEAIREATALNHRPARHTASLLGPLALHPGAALAPARASAQPATKKPARTLLSAQLGFHHRPTLLHPAAQSATTPVSANDFAPNRAGGIIRAPTVLGPVS